VRHQGYKKAMAPHLIERDGVLRCSVCQKDFPPNSQPSMSKAFAEHVRQNHSQMRSENPDNVLAEMK